MDASEPGGVAMRVNLQINGQAVEAEILERKPGEVRFRLNGKVFRFLGQKAADGSLLLDHEVAPGVWRRRQGGMHAARGGVQLQLGELEFKVTQGGDAAQDSSGTGALSPVAPMPGLVRKILVKKGDAVKAGDAVAVLEAMKLQLTLAAGGDAVVEAVLAKEGDMVPEGAELVTLKAKA